MADIQYNIAVSVFFVPYILLEVPSNLLLKKFKRPSTYLGILVTCWGIVMTFTGLVKNFGGLLACRLILAVFEAGFFPGAVYLITRWYAQRQLQLRVALFYCASALSGAFSGLLAFCIAKMDGVGGIAGWAWIFILEGIVTVMIGAATFFVLPDTPSLSSKWLDADEIRYLELQTVVKEGGRYTDGETKDSFKWTYLKELLLDHKVWLQAYILFTVSTSPLLNVCEMRLHLPGLGLCLRTQVHHAIHHSVNGLRQRPSTASHHPTVRRWRYFSHHLQLVLRSSRLALPVRRRAAVNCRPRLRHPPSARSEHHNSNRRLLHRRSAHLRRPISHQPSRQRSTHSLCH